MVSARFGFISLHGLWAKEKWVDGDAQIPMVFDGGLMVINGDKWWLNGDKWGLKMFYHLSYLKPPCFNS